MIIALTSSYTYGYGHMPTSRTNSYIHMHLYKIFISYLVPFWQICMCARLFCMYACMFDKFQAIWTKGRLICSSVGLMSICDRTCVQLWYGYSHSSFYIDTLLHWYTSTVWLQILLSLSQDNIFETSRQDLYHHYLNVRSFWIPKQMGVCDEHLAASPSAAGRLLHICAHILISLHNFAYFVPFCFVLACHHVWCLSTPAYACSHLHVHTVCTCMLQWQHTKINKIQKCFDSYQDVIVAKNAFATNILEANFCVNECVESCLWLANSFTILMKGSMHAKLTEGSSSVRIAVSASFLMSIPNDGLICTGVCCSRH